MDLRVNSHLVIPSKELQWRFSRASGPGGQSVNKTESRVELILDLKDSSVLGPFRQKRLIDRLENRLVDGCISVFVAEERSQYKNRQLALLRLADMLREGLKPPRKSRQLTKPTFAAQRRRIKNKKHRGALKQKRQDKPSIND